VTLRWCHAASTSLVEDVTAVHRALREEHVPRPRRHETLNSPTATTVTVNVVLACSNVKRASQPASYVFRPAELFVGAAENDKDWGAGLGFAFFGLRFSRLPLCSLLAIGCLRSLLSENCSTRVRRATTESRMKNATTPIARGWMMMREPDNR
jgi:hypothetical protein